MGFKCRTDELREKIISQYEIKLISHVRLLKGQEVISCTGDKLIDSYYCFSYKERGKEHNSKFYCGSHAGEHFLTLLKHPKVPMFDPLAKDGYVGGNTGTTQALGMEKEKWDSTARQLFNVINFIVICWSTFPEKALLDIKTKVEAARGKVPYTSQIKRVNTIISRDKRNRSLQQMIEELRRDNNIREFKFDLLNTILLNEGGIKSNFG